MHIFYLLIIICYLRQVYLPIMVHPTGVEPATFRVGV